jgi:transposase
MKEREEIQYVKRTQRDYSLAFKLQVVQEIERGHIGLKAAQDKYGIQGDSTVRKWLKKYGTFDWVNTAHLPMAKSPEQKVLELEQQVLLLEKQKASLEKQLEFSDKKVIFFDMMIDIAEEEFKIPIRKKCSPKPSSASAVKSKKA